MVILKKTFNVVKFTFRLFIMMNYLLNLSSQFVFADIYV